MDLFNQNTSINLLPHDGEVIYYGPIMNANEAVKYYELLMDKIEWANDQAAEDVNEQSNDHLEGSENKIKQNEASGSMNGRNKKT